MERLIQKLQQKYPGKQTTNQGCCQRKTKTRKRCFFLKLTLFFQVNIFSIGRMRCVSAEGNFCGGFFWALLFCCIHSNFSCLRGKRGTRRGQKRLANSPLCFAPCIPLQILTSGTSGTSGTATVIEMLLLR